MYGPVHVLTHDYIENVQSHTFIYTCSYSCEVSYWNTLEPCFVKARCRSLGIDDWTEIIETLMAFCEAHVASKDRTSHGPGVWCKVWCKHVITCAIEQFSMVFLVWEFVAEQDSGSTRVPLWAREALYHVSPGLIDAEKITSSLNGKWNYVGFIVTHL